jgi:hypothetical protein
LRAALLASWQAAASLSATPRITTPRPSSMSSQYQRPSPLGMTRNSMFGAELGTVHLWRLRRIDQYAVSRAARFTDQGEETGITSTRSNLRHGIHFPAASLAHRPIKQIHVPWLPRSPPSRQTAPVQTTRRPADDFPRPKSTVGLGRAQYLAGPWIDHMHLSAGEAAQRFVGVTVVLAPVARKPTLDPSASVWAEENHRRHGTTIASFRNADFEVAQIPPPRAGPVGESSQGRRRPAGGTRAPAVLRRRRSALH